MGDLIGSERAPSRRELSASFNDAVNRANDAAKGALLSPLTITLGDEFQGLSPTLAEAWTIGLHLRALLHLTGTPVRLVFGVATIETPINRQRAWNMMGPGLAGIRDTLNDKRKRNQIRFWLPDQLMAMELLNGVGLATTAIEDRWSKTQRAYCARRILGHSITQLVNEFQVSQHSIYKVLKAGEWDVHAELTALIGETMLRLDREFALSA